MTKSAWVVILIGYLAMIGAFWVEDTVFERLPQLEDEVTYLYQAKIFARGQLYIDTPEPLRAFWQPFLMDCREDDPIFDGLDCDGKRFGKYPPGWPLLLAIGFAFQFEWAINPFIFFLTIALTYRLAREIFDVRVGLISAILMATSPIALLQSGSLMAHPATLLFTTVTLYGVWRLELDRRTLLWGAVGGLGLGMVIASRPLVGAGLAIPLVLYSTARLSVALAGQFFALSLSKKSVNSSLLISYGLITCAMGIALWVAAQVDFSRTWIVLLIGGLIAAQATFSQKEHLSLNPAWPRRFQSTVLPLAMMGIFAILFGGLWPIYNYVTTGKATQNLYVLIWDYDRIGFGEGHGRYQGEALKPPVDVPIGQKIGFHSPQGHNWERAVRILHEDTECYSRDLFGWVEQPDPRPQKPILRNNECMKGSTGLSWLLLPLGLIVGWRRRWTTLLFLIAIALIGINMTYWIGGAVYSARYYYEATSILSIISAVGLVGLIDQLKALKISTGIYMLFFIFIGFTLISYTPDRLKGLYRYDRVGRHQIEAVDRWRLDKSKPVLVIAYGETSWRNIGALMALTSPFLDSEYIVARDPDRDQLERLLAMFPDREVVYYFDGQFTPSIHG